MTLRCLWKPQFEFPPAGRCPVRGMSRPLPPALALMGLLLARTMGWASSGNTHPELVNNLYSEYGLRVRTPSVAPRFLCCS